MGSKSKRFVDLIARLHEYEGIELNWADSKPLPRFTLPAVKGSKAGVGRQGNPVNALTWRRAEVGITPGARAEATMTRIGTGETAALVLFGGRDAAGLVPADVHLFDPSELRWCTPAELDTAIIGEMPAPRAGHSASCIGRHLILYFGGQIAGGAYSDEVHALVQHRRGGTATAMSWVAIDAGGDAAPCGRAYHAVAEMGSSLLIFGGEARISPAELEEMCVSRTAAELSSEELADGHSGLLPPLKARSEVSLSHSTSAPSLRLCSSLAASSRSLVADAGPTSMLSTTRTLSTAHRDLPPPSWGAGSKCWLGPLGRHPQPLTSPSVAASSSRVMAPSASRNTDEDSLSFGAASASGPIPATVAALPPPPRPRLKRGARSRPLIAVPIAERESVRACLRFPSSLLATCFYIPSFMGLPGPGQACLGLPQPALSPGACVCWLQVSSLLASLEQAAATGALKAKHSRVVHPLADLWMLALRGDRLEWSAVHPSGVCPTHRRSLASSSVASSWLPP